jgi:hypothetical protein
MWKPRLALIGLAACTATEPSEPLSPLVGRWRFEARLTLNQTGGTTCLWTGDLAVTTIATDTTWLGYLRRDATCSPPGDGWMAGKGRHDANGMVVGQDFTFETSGPFPYWCTFRGTVSGSPPSQAHGSVVCQDLLMAVLFLVFSRYEGEWTATR